MARRLKPDFHAGTVQEMRRTFAIGDIPGCRQLLERRALVSPDPGHDAVVILGDFTLVMVA